ncbi:hypothetical protein PFDG_04686, partial [Plasmodium falciparum Dd2]
MPKIYMNQSNNNNNSNNSNNNNSNNNYSNNSNNYDSNKKNMLENNLTNDKIYMNIYVKSILYNILYIKSDLSENKMDHIKVIKRNIKKNHNDAIEENEYINLKKNDICLLYTLCFKKAYLNHMLIFLNMDCLINDNTIIKFKLTLPFPHLFLCKPNSLYLNNFIKIRFPTFQEFINSLKLYNSFNVFHFNSFNILYTTYPTDNKNKILLIIVCDFIKTKNQNNTDQ